MTDESDTIADAAATWHVASNSDDIDWDAFTAWLAADPRHAAAYDEVALADTLLGEHATALQVAPAEIAPIASHKTWRWAGAAIAASLVAIFIVPQLRTPLPDRYVTQATGRTIALADGSQVALAPRSILEVSSGDNRLALTGGAVFDIRHDPARTMTINAGGVSITDIGTRFDVQATAARVRVSVAQGRVSVSSPNLTAPVVLTQGRGLLYDGSAGTAVIAPVAVAAVGEWRAGRLTYAGAPLALVAADVARYAGTTVTVDPSLAERKFSGSLALGDGEAAVRDLSQLMALDLVRDGRGGYRLEQRR